MLTIIIIILYEWLYVQHEGSGITITALLCNSCMYKSAITHDVEPSNIIIILYIRMVV